MHRYILEDAFYTSFTVFFVGQFTIIMKDSGMLGLFLVTISAENHHLCS